MSEVQRENLETEKLRLEIRGLKRQRTAAILGVVGAVGAFLLSNLDRIADLIWQQPKLQILVEDEFLRRNGVVEIQQLVAGKFQSLHRGPVAAMDRWLPLQEGSYRIRVLHDGSGIWEEEVVLQPGDRHPVVVAAPDGGIRIDLGNPSERVQPGAELRLAIQASGNGFLWIYELSTAGNSARLFPPSGVSNESNAIEAGRIFDFGNRRISAGDRQGEERLLFVVTSTRNPALADEIAERYAPATISKAQLGEIKQNWGTRVFAYRVEVR